MLLGLERLRELGTALLAGAAGTAGAKGMYAVGHALKAERMPAGRRPTDIECEDHEICYHSCWELYDCDGWCNGFNCVCEHNLPFNDEGERAAAAADREREAAEFDEENSTFDYFND